MSFFCICNNLQAKVRHNKAEKYDKVAFWSQILGKSKMINNLQSVVQAASLLQDFAEKACLFVHSNRMDMMYMHQYFNQSCRSFKRLPHRIDVSVIHPNRHAMYVHVVPNIVGLLPHCSLDTSFIPAPKLVDKLLSCDRHPENQSCRKTFES